jgi:hypothetical protein
LAHPLSLDRQIQTSVDLNLRIWRSEESKIGEHIWETRILKTDVKAILEQMTLEEKTALCTGANPWQTTAVERLGVPTMTVSDGPHGVRRIEKPGELMQKSLPATCFPTASALASSCSTTALL